MLKYKYIGEFEFKISKKILFPYINTASGLARWFADDVIIDNEDKVYTFIWDGEETKMEKVSSKGNYHVRFNILEEGEQESNYFDFKIVVNELTQTVYLRIIDYSDMDEEQAENLWNTLIHDLKEIVGR